ncbi:hypothetical protein [Lacrimispora sp.]|uniref:hypothetical protein n=1 Tax=Lacrimispora sp. TaxID=2719234 RepID=UPI002FDA08D4
MEEGQQILKDWGMELFVGNNYRYYKNKWDGRPENQNFSSWNWTVFLFPVYWLVYRKMYLEALLSGIISVCLMIIPGAGVLFHIFLGIYAESHYRKKGIKVIAETSNMTESDAKQYISKRGGTSTSGVIIAVFIVVLLAAAVIGGAVFLLTAERETYSQEGQSKTFTAENLSFSFPDDWVMYEEEHPFDLQCIPASGDSTTGVFAYEIADFGIGVSPEDILEKHINDARIVRDNFEFIEDMKDEEIGDKRIKTVMYFGELSGMENYYIFSLVELKEYERFAVVLQVCLPDNLEEYKPILEEIVSSCAPL